MPTTITRRDAIGLLAGAAAAPLLARSAAAQPAWWQTIPAAAALVGDAQPSGQGIAIELPLVSEDGSAVDLAVAVDRPMTQDAFVESIHVFARGNPSPEVAEYYFSPLSGRAAVATRIRLNQSQTVGAVAVLSTGEVIAAARDVTVTISGCLARDDTYAATDIMQTRVRAPERIAPGGAGEVTTLVNHPMETGLRTDAAGTVLPEDIVRRLIATFDRATIFEARFHRSVAANPYLRFFVAPPRSGALVLRWEADGGRVAEERLDLVVS
ncbi:MAG: thiosulfate oxidation carrier complex protein SoxZ [Bauldia sp.]|nr:thiosulfate oxidation carrier complex protein SoxZ [Bauldia sp.]